MSQGHDWLASAEAVPGFMETHELEWLHDTAAKMESVVEIGCWKGRSTIALASGCPGPVWTVDTFEGSPSERDTCHSDAREVDLRAVAIENLAPWPNARVILGQSVQASRMFQPASVDMVFIDGDHETLSVLMDLLAWRPICRRLFCGHDVDWDGVQHAIGAFGQPFERGPGSIWYMEVIR